MSRLWHEGTIGIPQKDGSTKIAHYWVKAYDEGSAYGINEGKISKLQMTIDGEMVASYDRGWDIEPAEDDEICSTYIQKGKDACKGIRVRDELLTGLSFTEPMVVEEVFENGKKHYGYTSKRAYDCGERAADRIKEEGRSLLPRVNRSRRTVIEL